MRFLAVLVTTACLLLAGCGSTPLRSGQARVAPTVAHTREATVIYVTEGTLDAGSSADVDKVTCKRPAGSEAGGFAPLLVPLAGMAADSLVSVVAALLAKAKDDRTGTWSASLGGVSLQSDKHYCLALSRGIITDDTSANGSVALNKGLSFQGVPAFVLLADLAVTAPTESSSAISLRIAPKFLSYAETSAASRGKKKKDVSVLLAFNGTAKLEQKPAKPASLESGGGVGKKPPTDAGKDDTAKVASATPSPNGVRLDFGRLEIGHVYGQVLLVPTVASLTVDSGGIFTVSAVVTESEDPSIVLSAFASAFDSDKNDLTTALKKALGAPQSSKK